MRQIFDEPGNEVNVQGHVIVSYHSEYYKGPYEKYLAPAILHRWANAKSEETLIKYVEAKACVSGVCNLISIMAELTGPFPELIASPRRVAERVNHDVTEFFRRKQETCSGIISTDFFLGNGIIDVTIEANTQRTRRTIRPAGETVPPLCHDRSTCGGILKRTFPCLVCSVRK
ncbi:hypothetical protein HPB50_022954 [Hyalomma asiaticum]|uniref:Uncharacterized protein n=1 Tax=Hyalomma asiaticum TaxID=266040 RepID=A0ACB7S9J6_HYAAI|nr:hypothetical protein HPB50_022954 [Hyalomma asiaticum]